jgi:hypothetical protein
MSTSNQDKKQLTSQLLKSKNKFPKTLEDTNMWEYHFWNTQPMVKLNEYISSPSQITTLNKIENEYDSPAPYKFMNMDLNNEEHLKKLTNFIRINYFASNNKQAINYSSNFLKFLFNDGINLCLVAFDKTNSIILGGFIHADINKYQIYDKQIDLGEVSFLTVHPKLRNYQVGQLLIKEITRQINNLGYQVGLFTSPRYLPTPICEYKTYHRPINYVRTVESQYIDKADGKIDLIVEYYKVNGELSDNLIKIKEEHYEEAYKLYQEYMEKYTLHKIYTYDQFLYWFCKNEHIHTYVFVDENNKPQDLLSYYESKREDKLNLLICNLFVYTSNNITPMLLLKNLNILARDNKYDVVTVTNTLENDKILIGNKFIEEIDTSKVYLYNYRCPQINISQICLPNF